MCHFAGRRCHVEHTPHLAAHDSRRAAGAVGETDDEMRTLHLVRQSRRGAVWLTVGIATVSFVLSFTSLRELAAMSAWPGWPSWLWPLIIDGTIILATLGIVSFAPYRNQFWNQVFLWLVLGIAALVSLGGNSFHAWLSTSHLPGWMRIGSAGGLRASGRPSGDHSHPGDAVAF